MLGSTRRLLLLTAVVLALAALSPGLAFAGPIVDRAAAALANDPGGGHFGGGDFGGGDFGGGDFGGGGDF